MKRRRRDVQVLFLLGVLTLIGACRARSAPFPTFTPSPLPPTSTPRPADTPPPTSTPTPTSGPLATPTLAATAVPAVIRESWVHVPPRPLPSAPPSSEPVRRVPNARRDFWIVDGVSGKRHRIPARLRIQTAHVAMWVQEGVWHDIRELEEAAAAFEAEIYPRVQSVFGSEWTPGIDQDSRIVVLHAADLGDAVLGYTSSLDPYPKQVHPLSNEAEMITANLGAIDVGSPRYHGLLAGELQRLVHWNQDRNEERWVEDGLAHLGAALVGSAPTARLQAYLEKPDVCLTHWLDSEGQQGAAYLLMAYVHQRFGDEGIRTLTAEPANGVQGFEAILEDLEVGLTFHDLFADWLAAVYLDALSRNAGVRDTFPGLELPAPTVAGAYEEYPVEVESSLNQYGAHHIVLRGGKDLQVHFTGEPETPLLSGVSRVDGPAWWSNRADESLTRLTGRFDLRGMEQPALRYRVWYDIEQSYDYAFVELSADGGETWDMLRTPSGTDLDPHGNNPGWGYTGRSGGWITEAVEVSNVASEEVLVRFSYLTDGALTGEGLLLDDVSIGEVDGGSTAEEGVGRWRSDGFVLTDGLVDQRYLALLVSKGEELNVERLALEEGLRGEWTVQLGSEDLEEAVLILSAMAPHTRQPTSYRLTARR